MTAYKTLTLLLDGKPVGTAVLVTDRRGIEHAVIDEHGAALVPITARLTPPETSQ